MCEDILKIAGLTDYEVVAVSQLVNADIAIVLSETKTQLDTIRIKLNTYQQIIESATRVSDEFNTQVDEDVISKIQVLIDENNNKKDKRKQTKIKVYSNFLSETVKDMGYTICDDDYDYVVIPDFMKEDIDDENTIIIPSHSNVTKSIIERLKERYELLEI
jgi:segregation and condensation protein B